MRALLLNTYGERRSQREAMSRFHAAADEELLRRDAEMAN